MKILLIILILLSCERTPVATGSVRKFDIGTQIVSDKIQIKFNTDSVFQTVIPNEFGKTAPFHICSERSVIIKTEPTEHLNFGRFLVVILEGDTIYFRRALVHSFEIDLVNNKWELL